MIAVYYDPLNFEDGLYYMKDNDDERWSDLKVYKQKKYIVRLNGCIKLFEIKE